MVKIYIDLLKLVVNKIGGLYGGDETPENLEEIAGDLDEMAERVRAYKNAKFPA